jgi:predicted type IV restriction endonuclease
MNNPFPTLNLPPFNANIRREGKNVRIFDTLRQRFVALTPEEWVRQHFVNMLLTNYGFSSSLTANEVSLSLNGMSRRCDTVVYDKQLRPRMILEYKRPSVEITQRVFDQICRYNMVMHVDYLVVSNGMQHFACRMDYERQTYEFLKEIPNAETVLGNE